MYDFHVDKFHLRRIMHTLTKFAGFAKGASTANPAFGSSSGPCWEGHYCPEGTSAPQPCPLGTFSNVTHGQTLEDCNPCPDGFYCEAHATTSPQLCKIGYYCTTNTTVPTHTCPSGTYCPVGTAIPQVRYASQLSMPNKILTCCYTVPSLVLRVHFSRLLGKGTVIAALRVIIARSGQAIPAIALLDTFVHLVQRSQQSTRARTEHSITCRAG